MNAENPTAQTATATSPREITQVLLQLQQIDDEIREIRQRRKARLEHLERLRKVITHMEGELGDKRGKLAEAEQWHRTKTAELEVERDRLNKAKAKMQGVSRSKEYVAVNKELDIIRKNITTREDDIENLVKAIDDFRAAIAKEETKFNDWRAEADQTERENQASLATMDAKIAEVDARRAQITARIDKAIVRRYERIADAREGRGIVEVVSEACTGCNMGLQPRFVEILLRASSLVQCPHCNRYLFGDVERAVRRQVQA